MKSNVIKLEFDRKIDGTHIFFFGSLAAIFDHFTPEQVGCKLYQIYEEGLPFRNNKCCITKHTVIRKKSKKSITNE